MRKSTYMFSFTFVTNSESLQARSPPTRQITTKYLKDKYSYLVYVYIIGVYKSFPLGKMFDIDYTIQEKFCNICKKINVYFVFFSQIFSTEIVKTPRYSISVGDSVGNIAFVLKGFQQYGKVPVAQYLSKWQFSLL